MKEPTRQTIVRAADEPKLELGEVVRIREGEVGVVLARFVRSGDDLKKVHYVIELRSEKS
jgi:hypothetical protein